MRVVRRSRSLSWRARAAVALAALVLCSLGVLSTAPRAGATSTTCPDPNNSNFVDICGDGFMTTNDIWFAYRTYTLRWIPNQWASTLPAGLAGELDNARTQLAVNGGFNIRWGADAGSFNDLHTGEIGVTVGECTANGQPAPGCTAAIPGNYVYADRALFTIHHNSLSDSALRNIVMHEMGHAVGLGHYSASYNGSLQMMYPYVTGLTSYQSGDVNGLSQLARGATYDYPPTVTSLTNPDGRAELARVDGAGALWRSAQIDPSGAYEPWTRLNPSGPTFQDNPAIARNVDGRLEVWAASKGDGTLWHASQVAPYGALGPWQWTGQVVVGSPAIGRNADGRLEVFGIDASGALVHAWQTSAGGTFGGFFGVAGATQLSGNPSVSLTAAGRLGVAVRTTSTAIQVWTQSTSGWSGGTVATASGSNPTLVREQDGHATVLYQSGLYVETKTQTSNTDNAPYGNLVQLGYGVHGTPGATLGPDGKVTIVTNLDYFHNGGTQVFTETAPNATTYAATTAGDATNWFADSLAWTLTASQPTIVVNTDGSMAAFNVDGNNNRFPFRATRPAGGAFATAWSGFTPAAGVPGRPMFPRAVAETNAASVSWTPPENGGSPITTYRVTTSPGGVVTSVPATETSVNIAGLTAGTSYTFTVAAVNAFGTSNGPLTPTAAVVPTASGALYTPVTPARVADTRDGTGMGPGGAPGAAARIGPGQVVTIDLANRAGVPAAGSYTAVVLNVTAINPSATTHLRVYAADQSSPPNSSNLNVDPGATVAGLVTTRVSATGAVAIFNNSGTTDVAVDIEGYYGLAGGGTGAKHVGLTPARVLDTRSGLGNGGVPVRIGAGQTFDVTVAGQGGVPAAGSFTAVELNVTVVGPTAASNLTLSSPLVGRPVASNLNFVAGQVIANRAVVPVGADGKVRIYNNAGSVDVIFDVQGYFHTTAAAGSRFNAIAPARVMDTRVSFGHNGPLQAQETAVLTVTGASGVPAAANVSAVVANATAINGTAASNLAVWAPPATNPGTSNLNFLANQVIANSVSTRVSSTGAIDIFNNAGAVHVVLDLNGWYGLES